jgi:uncharacterized membrane protein YjjP (DUF1212 family)
MLKQSIEPINKSPLEREALRDVIDLSLWAGQLLLQHGAESARVEETVHRLGTGLGCDWMDILVSPNAIMVTTSSGDEFRTKIRRVVTIGVNMQIICEIDDLSRQASSGLTDRFQAREHLQHIDLLKPQYNRWLVVLMVGLACGAFSRLFGGDWGVFVVTFFSAGAAMFARQELNRHHFNPLVIVVLTAFVAGVFASSATVFQLSNHPQLALAASVLLLVPGVPLINSAEDLIKGHLVTGITRGVTGGLISLGIALGLTLAMRIMGVNGL